MHYWRDIWMNEGFATINEWLFSEHRGDGSAESIFETTSRRKLAHPHFWTIPVADPGPENLFSSPVYGRGAMTLQALRNKVGNKTFYAILRTWVARHRYANGTTSQFVDLAQQRSGQQLGHFFHVWLWAPRPPAPTKANGFPASAVSGLSSGPVATPRSFADIASADAHLRARQLP